MRIIVNPAAAVGRVGREWARVAPMLKELGFEGETVFTERPWHAIALAEQAVRDGHQQVVAVGGDGTVCQAAAGLYRSGGGTLGVLPLGTGNDIARTLGIPLDIREAAQVVLDGHRREVDLIRVGEHLALNAIGVGLLGDINTRAARIKRVRGIIGYLGVALVSLVKFESPPVVLETPDRRYEGAMTILAVHGGPSTGGGFILAPRAVPDDGLLDATLVPGIGPLGRLPRLVAAMKGLQVDTPLGKITYRALDHQSTMGAYVGRIGKKDGRGVMTSFSYSDGAKFLPSDDEVKKLRPAE